jgi:hypothetical protein
MLIWTFTWDSELVHHTPCACSAIACTLCGLALHPVLLTCPATQQASVHLWILSQILPIPVAVRCKAKPHACWDCGSEFRWGHGCLSVVTVVCCQAEVSATRWLLFQRSPKEYGVSECDRQASTKRRPWSTNGRRVMKNKRLYVEIINILWIEMWNEVVTA